MIKYDKKAYQLAKKNTKYNATGKAVVEKDDDWRNETEWDDLFEHNKEKMIDEYCDKHIINSDAQQTPGIDLRAYARYVHDNNLSPEEQEKVVDRFRRK